CAARGGHPVPTLPRAAERFTLSFGYPEPDVLGGVPQGVEQLPLVRGQRGEPVGKHGPHPVERPTPAGRPQLGGPPEPVVRVESVQLRQPPLIPVEDSSRLRVAVPLPPPAV